MNLEHDPLVVSPGSSSLSDYSFVVDDEQPSSTPITDLSKVIGSQFCAQTHQLELALITDDDKFVFVKDVEGNIVFHIKHKQTLVHERRLILDVFGNRVATIQRKKKNLHKRWKVYNGDNKRSKDLLFSARQSSSVDKFPAKLLGVSLAPNTNKDVHDFTVIGSWLERSFTFYAAGTDSDSIIAQMCKKQIGKESEMIGDEVDSKDMSIVTVYPKIDYAFIVALIVILDAIYHDHKSLQNPKEKNNADKKKKIAATNFATGVMSLVGGTLSVAATVAQFAK